MKRILILIAAIAAVAAIAIAADKTSVTTKPITLTEKHFVERIALNYSSDGTLTSMEIRSRAVKVDGNGAFIGHAYTDRVETAASLKELPDEVSGAPNRYKAEMLERWASADGLPETIVGGWRSPLETKVSEKPEPATEGSEATEGGK